MVGLMLTYLMPCKSPHPNPLRGVGTNGVTSVVKVNSCLDYAKIVSASTMLYTLIVGEKYFFFILFNSYLLFYKLRFLAHVSDKIEE